MKKMRSTAVLTLLAALSFTACQKEVVAPATTINDERVAGIYKVTALTIQPTTGAEKDLFATLDDCQKQSTHTLSAGHSYQLIDVCDPSNNQNGAWALHDNQKITINGVTGDLVSFDGNKLVISFDDFMGLPGKMTETLTRQ